MRPDNLNISYKDGAAPVEPDTTGSDNIVTDSPQISGKKPAFQVICLGSSGGPSEENVTGYLVRSVASDWARGSLLSVDAGSHLASIIKILERDFPTVSKERPIENGNGQAVGPGLANPAQAMSSPEADSEYMASPKPEPTTLTEGPFAGLKFPDESARANALHVIRNYVSTYLITHPHLDHLSGFAINTAAFHATSRPKTLAALPSTVDAVKAHIFNDIIWPNLTDEDGGVGFVTFQRLKEGGDLMVGEGEGCGYIDVSDGLGVKAFKVSHGVCTKGPSSHRHRGSGAGLPESQPNYTVPPQTEHPTSCATQRQVSMSQFSAPGTPGQPPRQSFYSNPPVSSPHLTTNASDHASCVVDSTAYFIRDSETHREILFFGDIEPDIISLSPRNHIVWAEAARKIARGLLGAIFIECSYDDSQADAFLFGHLNPKHLIGELQLLARMTAEAKTTRLLERSARKRKRSAQLQAAPHSADPVPCASSKRPRSRAADRKPRRASISFAPDLATPARSTSPSSTSPSTINNSASDPLAAIQAAHANLASPPSPPSPKSTRTQLLAASQPELGGSPATAAGGPVGGGDCVDGLPADGSALAPTELPLVGLQVIIIHVKDTLRDGPPPSTRVLAQVRDYEARLRAEGQGLGCTFDLSRQGGSVWV